MSQEPKRSEIISDVEAAFKSFLNEKGEEFLKDKVIFDEADNRIVSQVSSGKVRNMYRLDMLIFETTDRLSVFDRVIKEDVPKKGEMLNCISQHNKRFLEEKGIRTDYIKILGEGGYSRNQILRVSGFKTKDFSRMIISKKLVMIPLELVVRGYLVGSAWKAYKKGESYCGFTFPAGLHEGQKLEKPILTPTTKAEEGHDMPVTKEEAVVIVANWLYDKESCILSNNDIAELCDDSMKVADDIFCITEKAKKYAEDIIGDEKSDDNWFDFYEAALAYMEADYYIEKIYDISLLAFEELSKACENKGILFIDTKFEFGFDKNDNICMGDEVGTPDSSRFAPADEYQKTGKIVSLDKQIVRDYCSKIGFTGDESQEIPEIPDELWQRVTNTYVNIAKLICGDEEVKNY